jgi:hypothetical protein
MLAQPGSPRCLCLPPLPHPRLHLGPCLSAPQRVERLRDNVAELSVFVEVKTDVIQGEEAEIAEDVSLLEGKA